MPKVTVIRSAMYPIESKKRRPRFSNEELAMLVNEVYNNKKLVFSFSNELKSRGWQAVTDSINSVCMVEPRTPEEVRRKWYYYLSDKKKEIARHKNSKKKINPNASPLETQTDLKILELLKEIDGKRKGDDDDDVKQEGEGDDNEVDNEDSVEGLVCEVDANALSLRSPPSPVTTASSVNGDNHYYATHDKFPSPVLTHATHDHIGAGALHASSPIVNGFPGAVHIEPLKRESLAVAYGNTTDYPSPNKHPSASVHNDNRRREYVVEDDEVDSNNELLHLEKRRLMMQEYQLQVLQDIHRQMQEDSARNRAFQEAFLDIQRQRLDIKRRSVNQKKN